MKATALVGLELWMFKVISILFALLCGTAISADNPATEDEGEYHTHTRKGDVAELVLIGGPPGRMKDMAIKYFGQGNYKEFPNDHRGILTFTGHYKGVRITLATSGMGVASLGIILPELIRCGARVFIRVGSCGSLIPESKLGDAIIVDHAYLLDGASLLWVPWYLRLWYKFSGIKSSPIVVEALVRAADMHTNLGKKVHMGSQGTTHDFNTHQARPGLFGEIPFFLRLRHWIYLKFKLIQCYSMEMSGLSVFCKFKAGGLLDAGIEGVFANRCTNEFAKAEQRAEAEDFCALVALDAAVILHLEKRYKTEFGRKARRLL